MAATEKTLAEKLIEAVGKKHPDLLKHEEIKGSIEVGCGGDRGQHQRDQ